MYMYRRHNKHYIIYKCLPITVTTYGLQKMYVYSHKYIIPDVKCFSNYIQTYNIYINLVILHINIYFLKFLDVYHT